MSSINIPLVTIIAFVLFIGFAFYCGYHYGWAAAAKKLNNDPENL